MGMVIENPGVYTTVQDEGRFGYEQFGVSPAGPMDKRAFHIANVLVGNDLNAAELEMAFMGAEVRFTEAAVVAVTGADVSPLLNGQPVSMYRALSVSAGDTLLMQMAKGGCRSYLAVAGGLDVPLMMGSRSTLVKNQIGGVEGRILKRGDEINFRASVAALPNQAARWIPAEKRSAGCTTVRVILGPQVDAFTEAGKQVFLNSAYRVSGDSDRMGYRLEGQPVEHATDGNIISDGIVMGSIQVPPAGQPIIMMADCQSIGGYTKIATVISVDLPLVGQCKAGDEIRFEAVDIEMAQRLYRGYRQELAALHQKMVTPVEYKAPRCFQISVGERTFSVQVEEHT